MNRCLPHRCLPLWLALCALPACEYREQASALTIEQPCYLLITPHTIVIRAQAHNDSNDGIDGLSVHWSAASALLTLDQPVTTTAVTRIGTIASHGVVATMVTTTANLDAEPTSVMVMASAAVAGDLLVATAEVRIGAADSAVSCPAANELDAGVDATPDATPLDTAVDATP
jgi:hypothetical protein